MKKTLSLFLAIGLGSYAHAQCLPNGISTNPASPVNTQLPGKTNLYFDWTQPNWMNNTSCQTQTLIESPFYKTDNLEILRASKDMLPQDGWELIRRDFGYTDLNTLKPEVPVHTYFILYNKYTGILRILLKTCRGVDYNGAKISIKFDATSNFQTAALDYSSTIRTLDDPHVSNPSAQSVSVFVNDKTKWFYADFPMTYDPCTCLYKSKINVVSQLIQNSQIQLQGSLTGTITSISNGQGTVNNSGSLSFKDFVNGADQLKKGYSSVDNFITETKNVVATFPNSAGTVADLTTFQNALKNNDFLKLGLAAAPWLKSAAGVLDFFIGGGKTSPQTVQLMPMAANLSLRVNGTMTTSNQYHNIIFSNPGSQDAQLDPDIYPFYNEILGVFNILNRPVMTAYRYMQPIVGTQGQLYLNVHAFKLKEPIKWVVNPASDLVLQDGQVAYVIEHSDFFNFTTPPAKFPFIGATGSNPDETRGFNTLEGKNAETGRWQYRTDYTDINCLGPEHGFSFVRNIPAQVGNDVLQTGVWLKLLLNFKRVSNPTAQNVLLVVKIPVRFEYGSTVVGGQVFNASTCSGGLIMQATPTEVSNFCSSNTYKTNRQMRVSGGGSQGTQNLQLAQGGLQVMVSPNPAVDVITLAGEINNEKLNSVQIIDAMGRIHYQSKEILTGNLKKTISCTSLSNGIYFARLYFENEKNNRTIKFVINR